MADSQIPHEKLVEAAARAYESVQHAAIGAAPEGMDTRMAYYFYERVQDGHGYGAETHSPEPCLHLGDNSVDDYPRIVARAVLAVAERNLAPKPGEPHPIDRAFYDLTVKERDYERRKCDRAEAQRDELAAALKEIKVREIAKLRPESEAGRIAKAAIATLEGKR